MPVAASRARVTIVRPSLSVTCSVAGFDGDAGDVERHQKLRAETLRLRRRPSRQITATHAGGEPEIVLDLGAAARLSAWCVPIEQERS